MQRRGLATLAVLVMALVLSVGASADETPVTVTHDINATYLVALCGAVHTEHFDIPDDAIVTAAAMHATADLANTTALDATVEVRVGASVLASNHTSQLPAWLGAGESLDVAVLNAALLNISASQGNVSLDLAVWVCPTLGVASVRLDQAGVTYLRTTAAGSNTSSNGTTNGTSNGTNSSLPPIVGISVGGAIGGTAKVGEGSTMAVEVNGTLNASVQISWFVDGFLVGHGPVLTDYSFSEGQHNVSVRLSDGTTVRTFSQPVSAQSLPPAKYPASPWPLIAAIAGAAIFGMAAAGTDSGRYLLTSAGYGSLFARLKQPSLLDHFVRGTLYQVIRENPGIHFAELRRRAKIGNGAASYHLRVLEKGGYIRVIIAGTKTHFHTTNQPLDERDYGVVGADREVLEAVTKAPGIAQSEIVVGLKRSASAVSRSVRRLTSLGYVETKRIDGRVHIFPRGGPEPAAATAPMWPDEGA